MSAVSSVEIDREHDRVIVRGLNSSGHQGEICVDIDGAFDMCRAVVAAVLDRGVDDLFAEREAADV